MNINSGKRVKEQEKENSKLKKRVVDQALDIATLKSIDYK